LLRYVFQAKHITLDVLLASVTVYILFGAVFVPFYTLIEIIAPHSFSGNGLVENGITYWQNFVYFSYVTLTTVGYGDILPVSLWAKSLVGIEAVSGTMYLTIVMARLVGLYASDDSRK
jgi:voltage-gated potassium channel Kch